MDARRKKIENPHWLGDTAVAGLIRARDWSRTSLGPLEGWPQSLRTALDICLHSASPVAVYWGHDLVTLYNDTCAEFLGERHPHALGTPAATLYSDTWPSVGPLFMKSLVEGVCTRVCNQSVPLDQEHRYQDRLFDFTVNPVRDEHGRTSGLIVCSYEITEHVRTAKALAEEMSELHRLQTRQRVLVSELQHRTRNLLAVVRAIASQTFAGNADGSLDAFMDRLGALARVQGLISRADCGRVKLADIVWAELEAYAGGNRLRLQVHGPTVRLANHQVQTVALALHELVTNALKHGALKSPGGQLSVTWETWLGARGQQRFALLWRESGVKMPPARTMRRGNGRDLIENALRFSLHADTQLVFGDDGVWCRIELPVDGHAPVALDPGSL